MDHELQIGFRKFVAEEQLFSAGDPLLLAISGGLDSVVLGDLLHREGYDFACAHVNFELRGAESDGDEAFVRALAEQWGVPFHAVRLSASDAAKTSGESVQMAARRLRYDWLQSLLTSGGYDFLLTAHHLDDSLETFLLHFLRGTGLAGLAGIPPRRGAIRRPLLFANRAAIAAYAGDRGLSYREDSSNADDKYLRNYLRRHVLGHLYALEPGLEQRAARNFAHLREARQLYDEAVAGWYEKCWKSGPAGEVRIHLADLRGLPFRATLLWEWLSPYGFTREQLRQALDAPTGTWLEADAHRLLVGSDVLKLVSAPGKHAPDEPLIASWDTSYELRGGRFHLSAPQPPPDSLRQPPERVWLPMERLQFPLRLRRWRAGDWFRPFGMDGRQQKLQDFFVNQKIDRYERERAWLLVNGNGDIIWLVGRRLDHRYRVTAATQQVLPAQWLPADE